MSYSDAHRRLMDLLAGWSLYTHGCAESSKKRPHPGVTTEQYERESVAIEALYQLVGSWDGTEEELNRRAYDFGDTLADFFYDGPLPPLATHSETIAK